MPKITARHINFGLIALTAFLIPLYQPLVRYVIGLLVLSTFFNLKTPTSGFLKLIPLLGYFVWLSVGLFWTEELETGWKELEYSMSFLIFPIIFWFSNIDFNDIINRVLSFFTFGYLSSTLICLVIALGSYLSKGEITAFYYADLSFFHHPSYMALFGNVSLLYLYLGSIKGDQYQTYFIKSNLSRFILIAIISLFILLLMSKAGIGTMLAINILGIIFAFKQKNRLGQAFIIISGFVLIILGSYLTIEPLQNRVDETWHSLFDEGKSESSTGARILAWEASWDIIKEHPIVGVGTGDLSEQLDTIYEERNHAKLLEKSLNSHNQFLESWGKNGIFGLAALIGLFVYGFQRKKDLFYFSFVLLVFINMMMESMLQIQSGIVFIAFLNSLLAISLLKRTA